VEAHRDRERGARAPQPRPGARRARGWRAASMAAVYAASVAIAAVSPAAGQGLSLIHDTEIEALLRDYARPIFAAAGLGGDRITVRIVNHDSFNAFVLDGLNVFIHTGALIHAKTPNEIIGVIAHETGHIAGAHIANLSAEIKRTQSEQLLLQMLGIGLMVAGAAGGSDSLRDLGPAGQAVALGGASMSVNRFLMLRRSQESAADAAGLEFLRRSKQSAHGMLETFERLVQFEGRRTESPYLQSHPDASTRIQRIREEAQRSPYYSDPRYADSPQLRLRHDLMRAKLYGFMRTPAEVFREYPTSINTLPARYARAIARNGRGKSASAIGDIDALIRDAPDNPFFLELKGDAYFFSGQPRQAVEPLRKASQLLSGSAPQIQARLAEVLLAMDDKSVLPEAIGLLEKATANEKKYAPAWELLVRAYGSSGRQAEALLAQAEASLIKGDPGDAQIKAKRAQMGLKMGSPKWTRAEDIVLTTKPQR